jgi:hypothetical protein
MASRALVEGPEKRSATMGSLLNAYPEVLCSRDGVDGWLRSGPPAPALSTAKFVLATPLAVLPLPGACPRAPMAAAWTATAAAAAIAEMPLELGDDVERS